MPTGTCPECDADVHVDLDTDKGEIVSCEECGTDLEVVGLDPVELDMVEEATYDEDEDQFPIANHITRWQLEIGNRQLPTRCSILRAALSQS